MGAHQRGRDLRPEEQFLVAAAKANPPADDVARAVELARVAVEWGCLLEFAERHHLHTLLGHNLEAIPELGAVAPRHVRERLASELTTAGRALTDYFDAAAAPLSEFGHRRIQFAVLKGAAFIATLYPWGTRWIYDIDVVVEPRDVGACEEILRAHGFEVRLARHFDHESDQHADHHQAAWQKPWNDSAVHIDLHWCLYPQERSFLRSTSRTGLFLPFRSDVGAVLSAASPVSAHGFSLWVPPPEELFVHCAAQLVIDRFSLKPIRAGDLYALVRTGLDWSRLLGISRRTEAAGAVRVGLGVAALMGAPAPADVLRELGRLCRGCGLASGLLTDLQWVLGHRFVPRCADLLLNSLVAPRVRPRLLESVVTPVRSYCGARANGLGAAQAFAQTLRLVVMSAAWAVVAVAAQLLHGVRARYLAAAVRDRLWKSAA